MKKTAGALLFFAFCLFAADFWQSKPYTEWSEKDAQKMMSNSPWARAYAISVEPPDAAPVFGGGDGVRGRGIGDDGSTPPAGQTGGRLGGAIPANQGGSSTVIVARWQSALPIKEALTRLKDGAAAATSPEASYLIVLSGPLESLLRGNPEDLKRTLINASSLSAKGKGAMRPTDVQISTTPKATEVLFTFSRSNPYTLDDKEVEFSTKLGDAAARYTFRLKDMVFNGKLEL
ncbi:MAG: hypothetical protein ABSG41_21185 [Bryobacteraceae bacterium]|jgi:hypothetical protein